MRVESAAGPLALGCQGSVRDRLTPPGRVEALALGRYIVSLRWRGRAPFRAPFFMPPLAAKTIQPPCGRGNAFPLWWLAPPPFPRKRGHYKAPLCCERLMKGMLRGALFFPLNRGKSGAAATTTLGPKGRCPLSASEHNPPPSGGHNPRGEAPSTFPYEPSEPYEPSRQRRVLEPSRHRRVQKKQCFPKKGSTVFLPAFMTISPASGQRSLFPFLLHPVPRTRRRRGSRTHCATRRRWHRQCRRRR